MRSFYEAQASCEARGSTLASFHTYNETQNVFSLIAGQPSHNLFIGLYSDGFGTFLSYFTESTKKYLYENVLEHIVILVEPQNTLKSVT